MIDASSPVSASPNAARRASDDLETQYEQFLTLLTAQIRHQDPLEPMDSSKFVSQLAQLSQVEQGVATNRNLEKLLEGLSRIGAIGELNLIGRDVSIASDRAHLGEDGLNYAYEVDGESHVEIRILSEDGRLVRTLDAGQKAPGELHSVDWDRRDEFGLAVPDDVLRVEISATGQDGDPVGATGYADARVKGVTFDATGAALELDTGGTAYADAILAARAP